MKMAEEENHLLLELDTTRNADVQSKGIREWATSTLIFMLILLLIFLLAICKCKKYEASFKEEVIHVTTINSGAEYAGRLEILVKSILLFHGGIVHMHIFSDARAQEVLSMMFQTWRLKRLRWSLYELERAHDRVDFIPSILCQVILMDTEIIILEDIAVLFGYFKKMEEQASPDMYRRELMPIRMKLPNINSGTNVGVVILDLKRMRQINWDDLWREETLRLLHEFGPPTASEQDTFVSLEYFHRNWCYRLPCAYNYQFGEWAVDSMCHGNSTDYGRVKMIEWTEINGEDPDYNMAPARTLLYMRDGEIPNSGEITLSVSAQFNDSFAIIDRVREWPGPVDLIVIGSDQERMLLNQVQDFLSEHNSVIGARVSAHFVHFVRICADISRPELILLAFDINALDISHNTYDVLAAEPTDRFTAIHSARTIKIGLKTTKKNAQRFVAERKMREETAKFLSVALSSFITGDPPSFSPTINITRRDYPSKEFCRMELSKTKPLIKLPF